MKSPFLLIVVVFDRFINKVLLLCHLADKCHSVCENRWELYTMPGLGTNFLFFFLSTPEQRTTVYLL